MKHLWNSERLGSLSLVSSAILLSILLAVIFYGERCDYFESATCRAFAGDGVVWLSALAIFGSLTIILTIIGVFLYFRDHGKFSGVTILWTLFLALVSIMLFII